MFHGVSTQIFSDERLSGRHAEVIRDAGLKAAEVYVFPSHFDCTDKEQRRELAAAFVDCGVTVNSLHAPFFDRRMASRESSWLSISHPNPETRRRSIDAIGECVDAAHALGASMIVIHFGATTDKNTHEVISALFSSMIRIEEMLLGSGVRAAYENIGTPTSLCGFIGNMIERYEFRNAGICLDIGHANINEEPATAVERGGRFLINVHASDNNGHSDSHDLPFLGNVKWGRVMRALLRAQYGGCLIFEPRRQPDPYKLLPQLNEIHEQLLATAAEEAEPPAG